MTEVLSLPVRCGNSFEMTRNRVMFLLLSWMFLSRMLRSYMRAAISLAMAAVCGSFAASSAAFAVLVDSATGTPGMFASSHPLHWARAWGWEYIFFIFDLS